VRGLVLCTPWWCLTYSMRVFPGTLGAVIGGDNVTRCIPLSAVLILCGVYAWLRLTLIRL
jgi:hypothetical protein